MKKIITALLVLIVIVSASSGCTNQDNSTVVKSQQSTNEVDDSNSLIVKNMGISLEYTPALQEMKNNNFLVKHVSSPYTIELLAITKVTALNEVIELENESIPLDKKTILFSELKDTLIPFFGIARVLDDDEDSKTNYEVFQSQYTYQENIGRFKDSTYYFGYNDNFDRYNLTEKEKDMYKSATNQISQFKRHISIFKPQK